MNKNWTGLIKQTHKIKSYYGCLAEEEGAIHDKEAQGKILKDGKSLAIHFGHVYENSDLLWSKNHLV